MASIDGKAFSTVGTHVSNSLTNAFVLHPVAAGLAFIAGLVALGGIFGSLVGTFIAIIAWIITLVVMVIDFVVFGVCASSVVDLMTNSPRLSKTMSTKMAQVLMRSTALACGQPLQPLCCCSWVLLSFLSLVAQTGDEAAARLQLQARERADAVTFKRHTSRVRECL
jgi:hypothetical protein